MAVNTAGQPAHEHPDANRAQHPTPVRTPGNSSHYSFKGQNNPTSGGVADTTHGALDNQRQGPTKLYLGKAGQGSEHIHWTKTAGNSKGKVVTHAAEARLSRQGESEGKAKGKAKAALPFRREGPAFGPVKALAKQKGQEYH